MLLQDSINNGACEKIIKYFSESYWKHSDFLWTFALSILGILVSALSVWEAGRAKKAARAAEAASKEASKKVHKQDIIIILTEILNECQMNNSNIQYSEASSKHTLIHKKICHIKGLYQKYLDSTQITYLSSIETDLISIRTSVDFFNNAVNIGNSVTNTSNDLIYFTLVPLLSNLSGNIELLKGSLQSTLFE